MALEEKSLATPVLSGAAVPNLDTRYKHTSSEKVISRAHSQNWRQDMKHFVGLKS